jgi:biotin synthase
MSIAPVVRDIVNKVHDGELLNEWEIHRLLEVEPHSPDAGFIMGAADEVNRAACDGKAEVHAQIGLNLSPCPRNCKFCAFAAQNKVFKEDTELPVEDVIAMGKWAEKLGANALFIMTTGNYPSDKFADISKELRSNLKDKTVMIANVGDFTRTEAVKLKEAGYKGIYHAVRMGEGRDTRISPETRLKTVEAARDAGLLIGTCVEPVGPEHEPDEIIEKIIIGREMKPCYSGAMRRITIPGSPLERYGMISEYQMTYLVAVVRLAMGRHVRGNCTHEPNGMGPNAGANLFWAEVGANPRDTEAETSKGRGFDIETCRQLFREADFEVLDGPSLIYEHHE